MVVPAPWRRTGDEAVLRARAGRAPHHRPGRANAGGGGSSDQTAHAAPGAAGRASFRRRARIAVAAFFDGRRVARITVAGLGQAALD